MQCKNCFAKIPEGSAECSECGAKINCKAASPLGNENYDSTAVEDPRSCAYSTKGEPEHALSIGEYIARPFKDRDIWVKSLIGGLLMLTVIGIIPVMGYYAEYINRIIKRNNSMELPDWQDWKDFLGKGLMLILVYLIYFAVYSIICTIIILPFLASIIAVSTSLSSNPESPGALCGVLTAIIVPIMLITLVTLVFSLILPIMQILYSRKFKFEDAFAFRDAFGLIFGDFLGYIVTSAVVSGVMLLASAAISIVSIVGAIPLIGFIIAGAAGLVIAFINGLITVSAFAELYYKNRLMFTA